MSTLSRTLATAGLAAIAGLVVLAVTSCGSSDPVEAGYAALGSGDFASAVARFDDALETREPEGADYVELSIARCRALAHVDTERALADFAALSAAIADDERFRDREVSTFVGEVLLVDAAAAVHAMDVGMKRFPDSQRMKTILERVRHAAENDEGAAAALSSLGYGGGGD